MGDSQKYQIEQLLSGSPKGSDLSCPKNFLGKILVIGGSSQYVGAPVFAATACLYMGLEVELITFGTSTIPVKTLLPRCIVYHGPDDSPNFLRGKRGICMGNGMGRNAEFLFKQYIHWNVDCQHTTVIDGDGLRYVNEEVLSKTFPGLLVLTPNLREAAMLAERFGSLKALVATRDDVVVVEKGHPDRIHYAEGSLTISVECPCRVPAGCGDVLAGAIAAACDKITNLLGDDADRDYVRKCKIFAIGWAVLSVKLSLPKVDDMITGPMEVAATMGRARASLVRKYCGHFKEFGTRADFDVRCSDISCKWS